MRLSHLSSVLLAGLAFCSAGCLNFDKQTFVITFNADKDEAQALLVYETLQVAGDDNDDLKKAKTTLETVFARNEGLYLGHPLLALELSEYNEASGKKANPRAKQEREMMRKHIIPGASAFFLNKEGELCATQTLTIKQASKFVASLNEIIAEQVGEETAAQLKDASKRGQLDMETLQLRQKAVMGKHEWVRYEPGRVSLSLVGSSKHFEDLKRGVINNTVMNDLHQLLKPKGPPPLPGEQPKAIDPAEQVKKLLEKLPEAERIAAFLAEAPWSVERRKDKLTVSLGLGDAEPLRFFSPYMPPKKGRTAPLVEHAKTLKVEILRDTSTELLITEFLKKNAKK